MKRLTLLGAALLAASTTQAAPGLSFYGGAYLWNTSTTGTFASGGANIDVERDLDLDRNGQTVVYVGVEHIVPLIPHARLRYIGLSADGRNQLNRDITFRDETFTAGTRIRSDYDIDLLDGTLYYSLMNNWVEVDLGLNIRQMNAEFSIASDDASARKKGSATFPMLYGAAKFNLPYSGTYAGVELSGIEVNGSRMRDYSAKVGWRSDFLFGAELGYSRIDLKLDDVGSIDSDLAIGGPYLALSLNF